jgi:crotonobetainyl-CoA:carnitine CoA-transferase CaiB-like acyl-CoA transferase
MTADQSGVLAGVRVLDFGRYIAGPYCATLLSDFGAEVIRIEKRDGSEDRFIAPIGADGDGALFMQINRNKKSVTLDPMSPQGAQIVKKLVATADIVVANLPSQTLTQMQLDYESLKAVKEDIILVTASAFGAQGPWAERVGFDGIGQAMCGSVYMTGVGDPPYRASVNWVDFGTALHCALGAMMALRERDKTGRGQVVEGSLFGTALTFANAAIIEQIVTNVNRVPKGNIGQTAAPSDTYRCKDGWLLVQVSGDPLFKRWAKLMGEDHWLCDPRFKTDLSRGDHGAIVSERMARWCAEKTVNEASDLLAAARIPNGPILSPQQAHDHPQTQGARMLTPVDYPGLPKPAPIAKPAVRLSQTPAQLRHRAPTTGEHTQEVLGALGIDEKQLQALRADGVV